MIGAAGARLGLTLRRRLAQRRGLDRRRARRGGARGRHDVAGPPGGRRRGRAGGVLLDRRRLLRHLLGLGDHLGAAFAVDEPDIVDRVLQAVQAGARGEEPARKDPLGLSVGAGLVHLDEGGGVGRFRRRLGEADPRRQLQGAELHRFVDPDLERDDPPGDLVQAGKDGGGILDPVRVSRTEAAEYRCEHQGSPRPSECHHTRPSRSVRPGPAWKLLRQRDNTRTKMEKGQAGKDGAWNGIRCGRRRSAPPKMRVR